MELLIFVVTVLTALGCGLIGGVFFAFSSFIMNAFNRLPAAQGIAAMQAINVAVFNRWFMSAFFGTAAGCVLLLVTSMSMWHDSQAIWRFVGSALYLSGCIVVTIVFNVPRNEALAAVSATSDEGSTLWQRYLDEWTTWNHVRAAAGLAAAAALTIALVGEGRVATR